MTLLVFQATQNTSHGSLVAMATASVAGVALLLKICFLGRHLAWHLQSTTFLKKDFVNINGHFKGKMILLLIF